MGLYNSIPKGIKQFHFNKELQTLFNSARVKSDFPYSILYLGDTSCHKAELSSDIPFYFLVTKEYVVHALNYDVAISHHSLEIGEEIIHVSKVQNSVHALVLKSGKVVLVTNYADRFERKDFEIKNAYFTLGVDDLQFLVIGSNYSVTRVTYAGEVSVVLQPIPSISTNPMDALILQTNPQVVVIISDKNVIVCSLGHYGVMNYQNIGENFVKLGVINPNIVFVLADNGRSAYSLKFNFECKLEGEKLNHAFHDPMTIMESHDRIFNDAGSRGGPSLVFFCNGKSLTCIDGNNCIMQYHLPEEKTVTHIYQLNSVPPNIILVAFNDGSVMVMRVSQEKGAPIVGSFNHHELENLHNAKIQAIASAIPLMFLTVDENNKFITWESFPNWWWAPNRYEMFKGIIDGEDDDGPTENA